jgi:hypothetical protein
VRNVAVFPKT